MSKTGLQKSVDQLLFHYEKIICRVFHVFDFLGTDKLDWGNPIHWSSDLQSGYEWNNHFHTHYSQSELMPGNSIDIKIPWELNRLQHLVTLGQAWQLTNDEKYSQEFFSQLESWQESNPFCYGINWTSTMEVAIRAVNLVIAVDLLSAAPELDENRKNVLNKSIRQHGKYIEHNLEIGIKDSRILAGNHYLANICGIAMIGMSCPGLPESKSKVLTAAIQKAMDNPEYGIRELKGHNTLWKVDGKKLKDFLNGLAATVGKVKFWDLPK